MDYEIRYAREDEWPAVTALDGANFGIHYGEQQRADAALDLDPSRILVTLDAGRVVGASAELSFAMALPGGADVSVTGLTWVSVEVTHRRRGVLRTMIERQLRASATAGDAATILIASEGAIYGRFGFGVATHVRLARVQRRRARIARPVDTSAVRRISTDEARDLLPGLHERWRRVTPGGISRDGRRWQFLLLDRDYQREGHSGLMHLVHPDGYITYRIRPNWGHGDPQHECLLVDYAPVTADAHAALWQTLLSMDLVGSIQSYRIPLDDPLPLLLDDPRGIDTMHLGDSLWVRPVDVARLLGSRRYGLEVECVLDVRDPLLGDGRYLLRGGPDGATCVPTNRSPDVTIAVADLGAVSAGGARLSRLARAGLIGCDDDAVLQRLDLALLADREPAHGTAF